MIYLPFWNELDNKRRTLLKTTDWTQVTDSPLSDEKRAEWAVYRQALRDIPLKWPANVNKETVNPYETSNIFPQRPQ